MSLLPDARLSPDALDLLRGLVQSLPQNELFAYAATGAPFIGGGFRKNSVSVIRARILQVLDSPEPVEAALRRLLARHDPCASCLALLSEETVKTNLDALAALFGRPGLALALQLDSRFPSLAQSDFADAPPEDAEDPAAPLRDALAPLLSALGEKDADRGNVPAVRREEASLRAELSRLKGAASRLEKEQANRARAEQDAETWRKRADTAEKALGPLRHGLEVAEAELARLRRDTGRAAGALVETRLAAEFADWLGGRRAALLREASSLLPAASPAPADPLLARAEDEMAKQARADLAAGTRHALESRLHAYDEALRRCRSLLVDALDPAESLRAIEKDLTAEVRRLRLLLHPEAAGESAAGPEEALMGAVNAAQDRELPDLQHMANRLLGLEILPADAHARIRDQIRNRYAALYARRGGPGLESGDAATPDAILHCALEGHAPLILLIDGHNALFALQSRYCRPQDHRGPSAEARDWLVNDLVQVFANARNCRVLVVFDGPDRTESTPSGNVRVVYSGGGGSDIEHRADNVLVDEARFLRAADPAIPMLLATNDNGLAARAASLRVRNLAPTALLAYFR